MKYNLVAVKDIPTADQIVETPKDDLISLFKIFKEMENVCDENMGIGLSAVQIGIPWKIFIVKGDGTGNILKGKFGHFIDCQYSPAGLEMTKSLEGCLSLRDENGDLMRFELNRYQIVEVYGKKLVNHKERGLILLPFQATIAAYEQGVVFQHEIDHTHGILISDRIGSRRMEIW